MKRDATRRSGARTTPVLGALRLHTRTTATAIASISRASVAGSCAPLLPLTAEAVRAV